MRKMAATLAFALVAVPALADHSRTRGGGGGGGGSSHPSGGSGGASSSSGSGGSSSGSSPSYSGSGGSHGSRPLTPAQARHPRAGTGSGYNYYHGGGYYPGYYPWYPWYYPASYGYGPYWGAYYYGYWPYGAYYGGYAYGSGAYTYGGGGGEGGGGEAYYQSGGGRSEPAGVRVLVDPDDAKVYVDGYYAGKVEQFDGMFQRLNLQRGRHEILISKDGYQGQRFLVYAYPGAEIKLESSLSKGSGEAPLKDLTAGRGGDGPETRPAMGPEDDNPSSDWPEDGARTTAPRHESTVPRHESMSTGQAPAGDRLGEVRMKVQPADATVYVDGEFRGTARETATLVLPSGAHRIEIVRPGFRTETREVDVRAGETQAVVVELDRP